MEIWKPIDGFENYEISNLGNVKSLERIVVQSNGKTMKIKAKVLKNIINNNGYYYVTPRMNGIKYTFRIHRLVATHFINRVENKEFVNHKDGNKLNNNINNLEWCTSSENNKHAYDTGLKKGTKKLKHHNLIKIINKETGKIYDSMIKASIDANVKYHTFFHKLKNKNYKFQKLT